MNSNQNRRSTKQDITILYEDNHLIVVNKRPGDIVQGDKTGDTPLSEVVKEYIAKKYNKPGAVFLGVVHRLDRPTSGVVLFARTSKALGRMNKLFSERETKKIYWAVVENKPPKQEDKLVHYMKRNPKQNKSYAHEKEVPDSKKAILNYSLVKELNNYYLLEIELETGSSSKVTIHILRIYKA